MMPPPCGLQSQRYVERSRQRYNDDIRLSFPALFQIREGIDSEFQSQLAAPSLALIKNRDFPRAQT